MKNLLTIITCLLSLQLYSQINIVPNFSFESGSINCIQFSFATGNISGMDFWEDAGEQKPIWIDVTNNGCNALHVTNCGRYGIYLSGNEVSPGVNSGNPPFGLASDKYIFIKQYASSYNLTTGEYVDPEHNAVGVTLSEKLKPDARYVMRMKIIPYSKEKTGHLSGQNHLRVFFTQKPPSSWTSNSNNQKWEPTVTNIVKYQSENDDCQWYQTERRFTVPADKTELKNLILYVERGAFGIDDVEIYEECPETMLIQKKSFANGHNYLYPYLDDFPYINQATSIIKAGKNVITAPPFFPFPIIIGDVIIEDGANVIFTAGEEIALLDGFGTESGAEASFEIVPCNTYAPRINTTPDDLVYFPYNLSDVFNFNNNEGEVEITHNPISIKAIPTEESDNLQNKKPNLKISISPNPNNGSFTLSLHSESRFTSDVFVYDIFGKLVYRATGITSPTLNIDITGKAPGIYLVRVQTGEEQFLKKVVVR